MDLFREEFSRSMIPVSPYLSTTTEVGVPGGGKARAMLLCCGVFLGMVGMAFTVMGCINYERNRTFEWTQLLGPVLLSVGVTFLLIGLCKFKKLNCKFWKANEEQVTEVEQVAPAHSFVFTGISQPIAFHGAAVVQYIPPPYTIPAHDRNATNSVQPGPLPVASCPPQYYTIYPVDNPSYSGDDQYVPQVWMDNSHSRESNYEERADGKTAVDEIPPAYEDIFPEHSLESMTSPDSLDNS